MARTNVLRLAMSVGIAAGLASAHHSGALYDLSKNLTVKGTVKTFVWANPHVVLLLTPDDKGEDWRLEFTGPGRLTRSGFSKRTFQRGDKVTVEYSPMRDTPRVGWVKKVVMPDGKVLDFFGAQTQGEERPNID